MTKYLLLHFWNYERPVVLSFTSSLSVVKKALISNGDVRIENFSKPESYKKYSCKSFTETTGALGNLNISIHKLYKLDIKKTDVVAITVDSCDNNEVVTASCYDDLMKQICDDLWFLHAEDKERLMSKSNMFNDYNQVTIEGGEKYSGNNYFSIDIKVLENDLSYDCCSFKITI